MWTTTTRRGVTSRSRSSSGNANAKRRFRILGTGNVWVLASLKTPLHRTTTYLLTSITAAQVPFCDGIWHWVGHHGTKCVCKQRYFPSIAIAKWRSDKGVVMILFMEPLYIPTRDFCGGASGRREIRRSLRTKWSFERIQHKFNLINPFGILTLLYLGLG